MSGFKDSQLWMIRAIWSSNNSNEIYAICKFSIEFGVLRAHFGAYHLKCYHRENLWHKSCLTYFNHISLSTGWVRNKSQKLGFLLNSNSILASSKSVKPYVRAFACGNNQRLTKRILTAPSEGDLVSWSIASNKHVQAHSNKRLTARFASRTAYFSGRRLFVECDYKHNTILIMLIYW